ncbi:MAG: glycosyltransferase family 4 protein [Candidatus Krumholzibacteriia bacterium]
MRVLFILSQRPELTGSGITVDALVRQAIAAGHEPWVLCGVPAGERAPEVGGLPPGRVTTVRFGDGGDLPFAVPGMSDVMPYASTVWSTMTADQLSIYRDIWKQAICTTAARCRPDLVHGNHLWLVSSLLPEALPGVPALAHCHGTGLRQMALCPQLREQILPGLRRLRGFAVLHDDHAQQIAAILGAARSDIHVVGAGYRDELFHLSADTDADARRDHLAYVGKFAAAKGLPWLLDACEACWAAGEPLTLHVIGDGAGAEAEALRRRMQDLAPRVMIHGRLGQADLADRLRRCAALVLPSFYEGLPLVLAEARACGCRLVSTALPGVVKQLAPAFGPALDLVEPPRLSGPDTPESADLPGFTRRLARAVAAAAVAPLLPPTTGELAPFTWAAVFARVEQAWQAAARPPRG